MRGREKSEDHFRPAIGDATVLNWLEMPLGLELSAMMVRIGQDYWMQILVLAKCPW